MFIYQGNFLIFVRKLESMFRRLFFFLLILFTLCDVYAQPKHEIRGAWLTTLMGLDWPRTFATSPYSMERQQAELCEMLDALKMAGVNMVFFQTRLRSDVAYFSNIEPMSKVFTGTTGNNPGYDPLAFTIEECHKRGMECHAWIVAIPVGNRAHQREMGAASLDRRRKDLMLYYKDQCYMNPGNPDTKNYLGQIVEEIVSQYDVDGVQFDYLRYPEFANALQDQTWYNLYGEGRSRAQWRRDNLTEIIRHLYHTVKEIKPWVAVSTCPLGRYGDLPRYSASTFTAFNAVFQDPKEWLQEGIQDLLFPMMYYRNNYFYPFVLDWKEASNGRPVVPGLGIYFLDPSEGNWTLQDVRDQMAFCRASGIDGIAYYRAQFLIDNVKGLRDEVIRHHSFYPSLLPSYSWIDSIPPTVPLYLNVLREGLSSRLSWVGSVDDDTRIAPVYNIYASDQWPVDVQDVRNLIAVRVRETEYTYNKDYKQIPKRYFAVTASDRCHNESAAAQMPQPEIPDSVGVVLLPTKR